MSLKGIYNETGKGPYRHQTAKWKAAIAVNCGDLVYRDSADGYDKPAGSFAFTTDLATTQANFKPAFRGVSTVRRSAAQLTDGTQATDGPVLGTGEFTFPCAALGSAAVVSNTSFVTLAKQSGSLLEPQKVVLTATASLAIGKLTRDAAVGATELTFELIVPTFANPAA